MKAKSPYLQFFTIQNSMAVMCIPGYSDDPPASKSEINNKKQQQKTGEIFKVIFWYNENVA